MAGGAFDPGVDKIRPGLYINFKAAALARITSGERGTVTIPLITDWGPTQQFITIEQEKDVFANFARDINDSQVIYIREAFKNASKILAYRLNTGTQASATWGSTAVATVTAKYGGVRGNALSITAAPNVVDSVRKDVKALLDGKVVAEQTVQNIEELQSNDYVTFSGTGAVEDTASVNLSGGNDGTVTNQDYSDYLSATETQFFDVIAYPVDEPTLKTAFVTFIKRMRDQEGKKIVGIIPEHSGDYEGIINVKNGVALTDGTILTAKDAVAWAAGASAGAGITDSNTYKVYEGAADANPRYTNSEIVSALNSGEFLFVNDGEKVKVEQDINSLTTFTQEKNELFRKNRVLRTLDAINNDLLKAFANSYTGKIDNNEDGQALLKDAVVQYLQTLQDAGALKNLAPDSDVYIDPLRSIGESVYVTVGVQPVDSMEKFYFTVEVR